MIYFDILLGEYNMWRGGKKFLEKSWIHAILAKNFSWESIIQFDFMRERNKSFGEWDKSDMFIRIKRIDLKIIKTIVP